MDATEKEARFEVGIPQGQGVQIGDYGHQTNIFQLFGSAPPSLSSQIRSSEFRTLIDERTKNFVGRDFVFEAIDNAIRDDSFPSGYIVVRGEPGIGKTAVIGELVKRRNCVHHFNVSSQNIRGAKDFLSNVCAQLIVKYELPYTSLPPDAISDSGFLSRLLVEVSTKCHPQPAVIAVDALDEADDSTLPPEVNCLYLPAALPSGIFFVVSAREAHDQRLQVDREKPIYLRENDPQNQRDVQAYITNSIHAHREKMAVRITEWGILESEFVQVLTAHSEGNFMYLVFVLFDIRNGLLTRTSIDDIHNLPKGLQSYYQRHWRTMRAQEPERFEKYYEPVVCQLAVVREPVSLNQLEEWTGLPPMRISEVVRVWRQFLNEDSTAEGEPLFRLYHASFQDFLREEVGLTRFHQRIGSAALKKIPSFRAAH